MNNIIASGIRKIRICFAFIASPIGTAAKKNHLFGILHKVKRLSNKKKIIADSAIARRVCRSKRELKANRINDKIINKMSDPKISFRMRANRINDNGKKIAALILEINNNCLLGIALWLSIQDFDQSQSN